ncbi:MAG: hypothetical protein J5965_22255 [Aeriscardovia sp.]|nr:hypothetical protein [Aeriscardovia sp.]
MLKTLLICPHCGAQDFSIDVDPRNGNATVICGECGDKVTKVSVYSMQEDFDAKDND